MSFYSVSTLKKSLDRIMASSKEIAGVLKRILARLEKEENSMNFDIVISMINDKGYEAEIKDTVKGKGFLIGKPGINVRPVIYYDSMVMDNMSELECANYLIDIAEKNMPEHDFNVDEVFKWESVKDNLRLCMRPHRRYSDDAVIDVMYDMEKYVRILINNAPGPDSGLASIKVTNAILDNLGVSKVELFDQALKDTHKDYFINDLGSMLAAMLSSDAEIPDPGPGVMVMTTKDNVHGASAICDAEILKTVSEKVGGDFYILPSSIHEMLAIPTSTPQTNAEQLRAMVKEVNDTQVAEDERVSYSVFYYDADAEMIRRAG